MTALLFTVVIGYGVYRYAKYRVQKMFTPIQLKIKKKN